MKEKDALREFKRLHVRYIALVKAAQAVVRWGAENSIGAGCGPKPIEELKRVLEKLGR